jgi:phosphoribosylformylglycinamidine synthase
MRPDLFLFGESQSRIVLTADRADLGRLRAHARRHDVPLSQIGEVRAERLEIGDLVDLPVERLREAWQGALERALGLVR